MLRVSALVMLTLLLPAFGGTALAADLDDGSPTLETPIEPAPVVEPVPVAVPVAVPVPVFVPVLPFFAPAPPPPPPSPTIFSAQVAYYPPPPPIPHSREPSRAEAEYYGYGRRHRAPERPLGYYPPDALD